MHPLIQETTTAHTPESLVEALSGRPGMVLLRSSSFDSPQARYSLAAANPFLTFRSSGSRCEITRYQTPDAAGPRTPDASPETQFGNPWQVLDALMSRFELLDEIDLPFPLGGCFGYWGYDLKNFTEPKLPRHAVNDLELPDCHVGFYDSLVVFDHQLGKVCIVSTGLDADGSRSEARAREQIETWWALLSANSPGRAGSPLPAAGRSLANQRRARSDAPHLQSNLSRAEFLDCVERAQRYIRAGDIYQVNLSQRLTVPCHLSGWQLFERLSSVSPAPFSAFFDFGDFQTVSSSPELFLRLSGSHIQTRPIKGTRPRDADPTRDAQLAYELQTSAKELAELVMITDLLRNDLGQGLRVRLGAGAGTGATGTFRPGATSGFHGRGEVADGHDPFCRAGLMFSRWQHHRRAEVSRHGNHRRTGIHRPRALLRLPRLSGLQSRKPVEHHHPYGHLQGRPRAFQRRRGHCGRFNS